MSKYSSLLGLPPLSLVILSGGISVFIGCVGLRVYHAPNLALKIANAQLITSTSADKLENLAQQLKEQAEVIEQKDKAYQKLENTYHSYLTNQAGGIELDKAFDAMENLPEVENLDTIQAEISETEEELLEVEIIEP